MHVKIFVARREDVEATLAELDRSINEYLRAEAPGQQLSVSAPAVFGSHLVIVAMFSGDAPSADAPAAEPTDEGSCNLTKALARLERELVTRAFFLAKNDVPAAAKLLGITEASLGLRIKRFMEGG